MAGNIDSNQASESLGEASPLLQKEPRFFLGEKDGEQLLPLALQWPMTILSYALIFVVISGVGSSLGFIVTLGVPVLVLGVAYSLAISFAGYMPPAIIVILMAAYWLMFGVFYYLNAILPFVIGSMVGVVHWFYLVVQLMGKASGQNEGDAYVKYTFLAPLSFCIVNALCYKIEDWSRVSGIRWPLATAIGLTINLVVGKLGGAYHFSAVQYVRYIAGSGGLYVFVYYGIMKQVEAACIAWAAAQKV